MRNFMNSNRLDLIRKKKIELLAHKVINNLLGIKFVRFEDEKSLWIKDIDRILEKIIRIDSTPVENIKIGKKKEEYLLWVQNCLNFLKDKKEWLILVPTSNGSIWTTVLIENFGLATSSLWDMSSNEFIIANKDLRKVIAIFSEEKYYEFHCNSF